MKMFITTNKILTQNVNSNNLKPIPLDSEVAAAKFQSELAPSIIGDWVEDVSERTGLPADYLFIALLTSISSIISHKTKVYPKKYDESWVVTPNLWGMAVGEPSAGKSPMLSAGIKFIESLEKHGEKTRLVLRDTTVEKLGEIISQTKRPVIIFRDELDGFFTSLSKKGRETDRAFFLESFNGCNPYSIDRIGRGSTLIEELNISILGGIQPSVLNQYLQAVIEHKVGDDGFLQRFQLAVWPEVEENYGIDRQECKSCKSALKTRFETLFVEIQKQEDKSILHFCDDAQEHFNDFSQKVRKEVRSGELHSSFSAHLAKYDSLVPSLAVIFEKFARSNSTNISQENLLRALKVTGYLRSHALKIFSFNNKHDKSTAKILLAKKDNLPRVFRVRDIQQKGWMGLTKVDFIKKALDTLVEHRYLKYIPEKNTPKKGGRPGHGCYEWIDYPKT